MSEKASGGSLGTPKAESESVELLQWALPRLSLAWPGFRRVRRQVCRRIGRRVEHLKLPDWEAYRLYLETHPEEWALLDSFCRIPISRFFRDRAVFDRLGTEVLPALAQAATARGDRRLRCWSAGCASGEEPYSLMILWKLELAHRFPDLSLSIVATDVEERLLERARAARFRASSLRELPPQSVETAFTRSVGFLEMRPEFREGIEFRCEDIRKRVSTGPFDLILCRNVAFTYFDAPLQRETAERILRELRPGGALVVGLRERLPEGMAGVAAWDPRLKIYKKVSPGDTVFPRAGPAIGTTAADDALEIGVEMELTVGPSREPGVEELDVEIVERKGLGHPDTICDGLAEEFSIALSRFYVDRFGEMLHHNVDKVLLRGGAARPAFGGGEVLSPIEIYLAGRATSNARGIEVPIESLAVEASRAWLRRTLHALDPDRHVRFHCLTRPGSEDLVGLFARGRMANDTSIGVGFAPMSDLERTVAAVASRLNASELKTTCPEVGEDIKVMGIRRGRRIGLTIACAFLGGVLRDIADYLDKKDRVRRAALETAASVTDMDIAVEVNAADDPARGEAGVYITVTGTSAEAGDDGEAGRGNRVNGLITPYRPMTLEAGAGKNPVTHVGKLYQIAAGRIAQSVSEIPGVAAAECYLASRIGQAVSDPQIADVKVRLGNGRRVADIVPGVERIVRGHLDALETVWREFLDRRVSVY